MQWPVTADGVDLNLSSSPCVMCRNGLSVKPMLLPLLPVSRLVASPPPPPPPLPPPPLREKGLSRRRAVVRSEVVRGGREGGCRLEVSGPGIGRQLEREGCPRSEWIAVLLCCAVLALVWPQIACALMTSSVSISSGLNLPLLTCALSFPARLLPAWASCSPWSLSQSSGPCPPLTTQPARAPPMMQRCLANPRPLSPSSHPRPSLPAISTRSSPSVPLPPLALVGLHLPAPPPRPVRERRSRPPLCLFPVMVGALDRGPGGSGVWRRQETECPVLRWSRPVARFAAPRP